MGLAILTTDAMSPGFITTIATRPDNGSRQTGKNLRLMSFSDGDLEGGMGDNAYPFVCMYVFSYVTHTFYQYSPFANLEK